MNDLTFSFHWDRIFPSNRRISRYLDVAVPSAFLLHHEIVVVPPTARYISQRYFIQRYLIDSDHHFTYIYIILISVPYSICFPVVHTTLRPLLSQYPILYILSWMILDPIPHRISRNDRLKCIPHPINPPLTVNGRSPSLTWTFIDRFFLCIVIIIINISSFTFFTCFWTSRWAFFWCFLLWRWQPTNIHSSSIYRTPSTRIGCRKLPNVRKRTRLSRFRLTRLESYVTETYPNLNNFKGFERTLTTGTFWCMLWTDLSSSPPLVGASFCSNRVFGVTTVHSSSVAFGLVGIREAAAAFAPCLQ